MVYLLLKTADDFAVKARYAFRQMFQVIGCPCEEITDGASITSGIVIYYGNEPLSVNDRVFLVHISACNFTRQIQQIQNVRLRYAKMNQAFAGADECDADVPYFFGEELYPAEDVLYFDRDSFKPLITIGKNGISCGIDLIAAVFFLLSLSNERLSPQRDPLNRFHQSCSAMNREIYQKPIVDIYVRLMIYFLRQASVRTGIPFHIRARWPHGCRFALALSHDVDRIQTWTFHKMRRVLSQRWKAKDDLIRLPWQLSRSLARMKNWQGNFEYIVQLEKKYHGRSSFFFVAKKQNKSDPGYRITSARLKRGIHEIMTGGFEIGLHGTIASATDDRLLKQEKKQMESLIESPVSGLRQHYLCFDVDRSPRSIEACGFRYDSTIGFSDELGYRCGTGFPYFLFDHNEQRACSFLEIPLILMDSVLFLESKLYFTALQAEEIVFQYLEEAVRRNGCITINWHNNNVSLDDLTGYTQLYEKILQWARQHEGWICSLDDLAKWWKRDLTCTPE